MIDFSVIDHCFTGKEIAALEHYAINGSQEAAYRAVYSDRMKPAATRKCTYELFAKKHMREGMALIKKEALRLLNEHMQEVVIDAAWVLSRAVLLANFNIKKFITVDDHGNAVYDFKNATDDDWYCISEYTVDVVSGGEGKTYAVDRMKLKSADKLKALRMVGDHVAINAFNKQSDGDATVDKMADALGRLADRLPD